MRTDFLRYGVEKSGRIWYDVNEKNSGIQVFMDRALNRFERK